MLFLLPGTFGQLEDGFGDLQDVESDITGSDQDSYAQTQLARAYQAEQAERAILSQFSDATAGMCVRSVITNRNCYCWLNLRFIKILSVMFP